MSRENDIKALAPGTQMAFDLPLRPGMGREDFLVTPCNAAALEAIERWPGHPPRMPALVLLGPAGSGRTHLAEIWRTRHDALRATAAELNVEAVPHLLARGALVLEDLPGGREGEGKGEGKGGGGLDEVALFHLLNMARESGAHVLITTTITPPAWPVRLPDLKSRLAALPIARLEPPDDELLRAVLAKLFADRQLVVGEEVLQYLLLRMERSLAFARDLVAALDTASLREKRPVTRHLAARVLRDLMPGLF